MTARLSSSRRRTGAHLLRLRAIALALRGAPLQLRDSTFSSALLVLIIVSVTLLLPAAPAAPQRIVAIGDIHGDLDAFSGILQRAHLVDPTRRWSGGNTIFVQTGDFLDRGPKARGVMDLLMALQRDATRQSGRVIVLMGNHEAMNIFGDLRYVTDADYV